MATQSTRTGTSNDPAVVPGRSILFSRPDLHRDDQDEADPRVLTDLNLDQVFAAMAGKDGHLRRLLLRPLHDIDEVRFRQEVMRDLEDPTLRGSVEGFCLRMRSVDAYLKHVAALRHRYQRQGWFLDAAVVYCEAVAELTLELARHRLASRGLVGFRDHLDAYVASDAFTDLVSETKAVRDALADVRYTVHMKSGLVTVRSFEGEPDYSVDVEETFARFRQGAVKDYSVDIRTWTGMNHVEERILDLVARNHPVAFSALDDFCVGHGRFIDPSIAAFNRDVRFYLAYLELTDPIRAAGLRFSHPEMSASKETSASDAFDLALARKRVDGGSSVVTNDFALEGRERVLVVTGPNQGGKTTFARTVGQLHYLAGLGYPVPGSRACLLLPDRVFTHFEREERIETLSGKLEDELIRIRDILREATGNSVLIMNESFTSTTLEDARFLGREILGRLIAMDLVGVYVTFVEELASINEAIVSMVSVMDVDDPVTRTYRIERRPADGLAYAAALAEKYGLTRADVTRTVTP